MAITVGLRHRTTYTYDRRVRLTPQIVRLRPAPHTRTPIRSYELRIGPDPHFVNWQQDPFGNFLARLVFPDPVDHLDLDVEVVAELVAVNPFDFFLEERAEHVPFDYLALERDELTPYLAPREPLTPRLRDWLAAVDTSRQPTVGFVAGLAQRLQREIAYEVRMEPGVQSCDVTLERRAGSCRDTGWLLVEILRHLGLAARFVSGYLVQLVHDQEPLEGPVGPPADFTDLHAWAEVYLPGAGWFGLDPTSGLATAEGHIPLACTPTPPSAAPLTGASEPCEVSFSYVNEVRRLVEPPRVTKPYTEDQWRSIVELGDDVDRRLVAGDVRLTMGGEPTFVSVDDMEGEEWTIAPDGPAKRALALDLTRRLWERFAPGGLLHCGQGKWYPGEPLPRWQQTLVWRADGEPLWKDPSLLAAPDTALGHRAADARRLAEELAAGLGLAPDLVIDTYEDPVHLVWREASLAVDADPLDAGLDDPAGRTTLARALEHGTTTPAGFVLPLDVEPGTGRWRTSRWPLRRPRLFAVPGTSPLGFRLPLETLPSDEATAPEPWVEQDPTEDRPPLPSSAGGGARVEPAVVADSVVVRHALTVEARDGVVCVFLPPLPDLEHAVDLIGTVERAARATALPVVVEGYPVPHDQRVRRIAVTPDPGVIEVNVHPTSSWKEYLDVTADLYEQARLSRLGTEKFQLDGRHSGTGGGNHLTLGGLTPADSPLLRRPSLLASLITYWQHHPALSYLFSGLFIGPTSQAPRVDEARHDNLYELEIAFGELGAVLGTAPGGHGAVPGPAPPWLVDRALRHLLTDLTGNTHRAEFCIDKLYSPDTATGRLGIAELRAFEMPPHFHMAAVQALLVRALVARFWDEPYLLPLTRWGTALHDRFLLPHHVAADIAEVVADLRRAGLAMETSWFDPFVEFRFPLIGRAAVGDVTIELRTAIEPWITLGEETSGTGTARYVDSSMERLQTKVTGINPERHVVRCNGRPVPLRPTATPGEWVAGVRYRAWHPPSALHPTIGVDSPLHFDLWDRVSNHALGGCSYHVVHPGGRSYDVFPVNALEAEARRQSRFFEHRHLEQVAPGGTAGPAAGPATTARTETATPSGAFSVTGAAFALPAAEFEGDVAAGDFPYTLDLRRRPLTG